MLIKISDNHNSFEKKPLKIEVNYICNRIHGGREDFFIINVRICATFLVFGEKRVILAFLSPKESGPPIIAPDNFEAVPQKLDPDHAEMVTSNGNSALQGRSPLEKVTQV